MTAAVLARNPIGRGGADLLRRMRAAKSHVLVHPYDNCGKGGAFAWILTDDGRVRVDLHGLGVLIRESQVRVLHVFTTGELLYEAVGGAQ